MAQFTQQLSGGPAAPISAQQPITSGGGSSLGDTVGALANLGTQLGGFFADKKKAEQAQQQNIEIVSFLDGQSRVADAVERGDITPAQARSKMRDNFRKAAAANPAAYGDLLDVNSKFMAQRGLGKIVEDETSREEAAEKEALANGFTKLSMTPEERRQGTEAYLEFNAAVKEMEALGKARAERQAEVNLESSQIALEEKKDARKSRQLLGSVSSSIFVKFRADQADILRRVNAGELTPAEAEIELKGSMQLIDQNVRAIGRDAGGDYVSSLASSFQRVHEDALSVLKGEMTTEVYKNRVEKNILMQELSITSSPAGAKIAAASRLLPNSDLTTLSLVGPEVLKLFGTNSEEGGNPANLFEVETEEGRADVEAYSKVISDNLKAANRGGMDEETSTQLGVNVTNILKGFKAFESAINKPEDLNAVVKLIASPEFGKYVKAVGGVDPSIMGEAKTIFEQQYKAAADGVLRTEYQARSAQITPGAFGLGAEWASLPTLVEPVFGDGGMSFKLVDPDLLNKVGMTNRGRLQGELKRLNKDLAPVVNRLTHVAAHLQGVTDYKKVYEEQVSSVFTGEEPRQVTPLQQVTNPKNSGAPRVGEVVNGFIYRGGDPRVRASWEAQ